MTTLLASSLSLDLPTTADAALAMKPRMEYFTACVRGNVLIISRNMDGAHKVRRRKRCDQEATHVCRARKDATTEDIGVADNADSVLRQAAALDFILLTLLQAAPSMKQRKRVHNQKILWKA